MFANSSIAVFGAFRVKHQERRRAEDKICLQNFKKNFQDIAGIYQTGTRKYRDTPKT